MERAIEIFVSLNFIVIGVSHIFQRDVWIEYFAKLESLGRLRSFAEGFLYLNIGALIVSFHNVWTFPAAVPTLIGWAFVMKALHRFVSPTSVLKLYRRMGPERAWQIQVGGGFFLVLAALCIYEAFT